MRRTWVLVSIATILLAFLGMWIARHTEWVEQTVPLPMKGEARTNPFYVVQRFAESLGARTVRVRSGLVLPPADGVVVLSAWHWDLRAERKQALEQWVESGGRLVVDSLLVSHRDGFEEWSDIRRRYIRSNFDPSDLADEEAVPDCVELQERASSHTPGAPFRLCNSDSMIYLLTSKAAPHWGLEGESGLQAARVAVGRGSVTVINAVPFRYRSLFDGDHARLFVAAAQLRRGDQVHFVSEEDHPSLLALVWRYGAGAVLLGLALVAALLWRGAPRFGPLAAVPETARRSVAEQIRGAAQFALRHGEGEALHAAAVRALDEAGRRRIAGYGQLSASERAAALERHTGLEAGRLADAIAGTTRRVQELGNRVTQLEAARRRLIDEPTGTRHAAE
jgi:hypothetical protein